MALSKETISTILNSLREMYEAKEVQLIADNKKFSEIEKDLFENNCIKYESLRAFKEWDYYPWLKSITKELNISIEKDDNRKLYKLCQN